MAAAAALSPSSPHRTTRLAPDTGPPQRLMGDESNLPPEISKQHFDPDVRRQGKVKWFDSVKGWGFIQPADGTEDIFVHQQFLSMTGFRSLDNDEQVEYEVEEDENRRKRAVRVTGPGGAPIRGTPKPRDGQAAPSGRRGGSSGRGGAGRSGSSPPRYGPVRGRGSRDEVDESYGGGGPPPRGGRLDHFDEPSAPSRGGRRAGPYHHTHEGDRERDRGARFQGAGAQQPGASGARPGMMEEQRRRNYDYQSRDW